MTEKKSFLKKLISLKYLISARNAFVLGFLNSVPPEQQLLLSVSLHSMDNPLDGDSYPNVESHHDNRSFWGQFRYSFPIRKPPTAGLSYIYNMNNVPGGFVNSPNRTV